MKTFGQKTLKRFSNFRTKEVEERLVEDEVSRITNGYGPDGRKLVVTLVAGDLVVVKEAGCRNARAITVNDLWWHLIRCEVNKKNLERARLAKEAKARRKEQRSIERAEAKLRQKARES
jgi:hypothetical protein